MLIKKVPLSKENLLEIAKIDSCFYNTNAKEIDEYLERYIGTQCAFILLDKNKIVGYVVSVPIKKELYDAIISGVLINDSCINSEMFVNESTYNYLYSCVILKEYRNKRYGSLLMEALLSDLKGKLCALTISKEGYKLMNKYMRLNQKINDSVSVFEI